MAERSVYLCSPLPDRCHLLFPLLTACLGHLSAEHPEHQDLLRTHGRRAFEQLPHAAILSSVAAPGSSAVFVCADPCREYFPTVEAAIEHFTFTAAHAAFSATILTEDGTLGLESWITEHALRHIRMIHPARGAVPAPPPANDPELLVRRAGGTFTIRFAANTQRGLAALLLAAGGPADWLGMMVRGELQVQFDQIDGPSGVARLRSDERVGQLRACMSFGVVDLE